MILKNIAQTVGVDISTVSRITCNKYADTPFGMILLKSLFSEGVENEQGELIIANLSFVIPYATWMIKGFIDALPLDMEEAGQVDGASRLRVLWDIVVPVVLPGIATAAVFAFVVSWNEFFYALVLTRDAALTMPVALMGVRTDQGIAWEIMAAMGLVIVAPMLLIARFIQKYFVKGLTSGAVR